MSHERRDRRLGIMGGTFDPVHLGHLVAAEAAREEYALERVLFVPTGSPPHKPDQTVTEAEHRLAMVLLATAGHPHFLVSRVEIDRPGPSYTVDTLRQLTATYLGWELYFITGADAVLELDTWKEPGEILRLCRLVVVGRPGYDQHRLREMVDRLRRDTGACINVLASPALAISSRELRRRAAQGRSLRYLVPREVEDYILKHCLYQRVAATS